MPYYELVCLAHGQLSRPQLRDVVLKAARTFMSKGGVVTRLHALGATGEGPRKLAYGIRKDGALYKTGFYVNVCAFASPRALQEVMRRLKQDEAILRVLPLRKDPMHAALPPVDVNATLPDSGLDPEDPAYELQQFLWEYEREFPQGQTMLPSEDTRQLRKERRGDVAVEALMDNLSVRHAEGVDGVQQSRSSEADDPGLAWLLDKKESGKQGVGQRKK